MDEAELKIRVASEVGDAVWTVDPRIWDELVRRRYVQDALEAEGFDPERAIKDLVDEYRSVDEFLREARDDHPSRTAEQEVSVKGPDLRLSALAEIIAVEAGRSGSVLEFRQAHLQSGLLEPLEVDSWIRARAAMEEVPSDGRTLEYDDGRAGRLIRVQPGGILDKLACVASSLSMTYDWSQPQAVLFVLTGTDFGIPKVRVAVRHVRPFAALSRITINVDPRTSPRELQRLYSAARLELHKGKDKDISKKHACLAIFAAEQGLRATMSPEAAMLSVKPLDTLTGGRAKLRIMVDLSSEGVPERKPAPHWAIRLKIWNDAYPGWAYDNVNCVQDFARDVRAAWERVTGRPWTPRKDAEDATDAPRDES